MTEVTHDGHGDFREQYPELEREDGKTLMLRHHKQPEEFGGAYEVRLVTPEQTVTATDMEVLGDLGYDIEYVGMRDGWHDWQLHESPGGDEK